MDKLICPRCKNEEETTSFIRFDDNGDGIREKRKCDDENCGCEYEVIHEEKGTEIIS